MMSNNKPFPYERANNCESLAHPEGNSDYDQ